MVDRNWYKFSSRWGGSTHSSSVTDIEHKISKPRLQKKNETKKNYHSLPNPHPGTNIINSQDNPQNPAAVHSQSCLFEHSTPMNYSPPVDRSLSQRRAVDLGACTDHRAPLATPEIAAEDPARHSAPLYALRCLRQGWSAGLRLAL